MLISAEHKIFFANKYENIKNSSYLLAKDFTCSAMFGKKEFAIVRLLVILDLLAGQSSCIAGLSMKKKLCNLES